MHQEDEQQIAKTHTLIELRCISICTPPTGRSASPQLKLNQPSPTLKALTSPPKSSRVNAKVDNETQSKIYTLGSKRQKT